jgi:hypothetical protein
MSDSGRSAGHLPGNHRLLFTGPGRIATLAETVQQGPGWSWEAPSHPAPEALLHWKRGEPLALEDGPQCRRTVERRP